MSDALSQFGDFYHSSSSTYLPCETFLWGASRQRQGIILPPRELDAPTPTVERWTCEYCETLVASHRDKCNCCGAFRRAP